MSVCTQLSDRMPDVALGRARWTTRDEQHLAACVDCHAEFELVDAAARLGAAGATAPDPVTTAARVLQRLRVDRTRRQSHRRVWAAAGLAAAAAAVLVLWTARAPGGPLGLPGGTPSRVATSPTAHVPLRQSSSIRTVGTSTPDFPLPELDSLSADALDSVLRLLDEPLARAAAWEMPDLGDPGDQELEQAFTGKEG
jgi:anti-sigma factor RsiW